MTDKDLFGNPAPYPHSPGWKGGTTSRDAAKRIAPIVGTLQYDVLETICNSSGMTADQVAATLGKSVLSVRPRVAELNKMGFIRDTRMRRTNISGIPAAVWIKQSDE
jgi:hypothetical protein